MEITIGLDSSGSVVISKSWERPVELTDQEEELVNAILDELGDMAEDVKTSRRSKDYVSLVYGSNDFVRVKATERAQWISIRISLEDRDLYEDDPLFDAQKNKNRAHWKVNPVSLEDIEDLGEVLRNACVDYED